MSDTNMTSKTVENQAQNFCPDSGWLSVGSETVCKYIFTFRLHMLKFQLPGTHISSSNMPKWLASRCSTGRGVWPPLPALDASSNALQTRIHQTQWQTQMFTSFSGLLIICHCENKFKQLHPTPPVVPTVNDRKSQKYLPCPLFLCYTLSRAFFYVFQYMWAFFCDSRNLS